MRKFLFVLVPLSQIQPNIVFINLNWLFPSFYFRPVHGEEPWEAPVLMLQGLL